MIVIVIIIAVVDIVVVRRYHHRHGIIVTIIVGLIVVVVVVIITSCLPSPSSSSGLQKFFRSMVIFNSSICKRSLWSKDFIPRRRTHFYKIWVGISQQLCYPLDASYSINECTAIWDVKNYSQFLVALQIKGVLISIHLPSVTRFLYICIGREWNKACMCWSYKGLDLNVLENATSSYFLSRRTISCDRLGIILQLPKISSSSVFEDLNEKSEGRSFDC